MTREIWKHFDYLLFGCVIILCVFGVVMIQSAAAGNQIVLDLVPRQMIYIGISMGVMLLTAIVDYRNWASLTRYMYIFIVGLLMVVFITARTLFGAARWLEVGTILIQPSELAKVVVILVLANYFARNHDKPHDLKWILRSLILTGGIVVWIILQPSLSVSIVIMVLWFAMLWISGLETKYIIIFAIAGLIVGVIFFLFFMQDYQKLRIVQFIFPDPTARHGNTYNVDQALITIGSGGWFGQGYGHGTQVQLRFLKVRHTDFIFSAMAEEFGFVGTILVTGLLIFVIIRCLRAARLASDRFGALIAVGCAVLIFFQGAVNIGVNLNVIPVTGLTLPFISYGGSSLLSLSLGIGLVESVIARKDIH
jgi:rod shape determining protein RodA